MKRKIQKKTKDDNSFLIEKIDDAIEALNKNEGELSKVITELIQRDLSEEDRNSLKTMYNSYFKSVEMVKKTMDN